MVIRLMLYLGVDVGTSSMKATVLNEEGRIIVKNCPMRTIKSKTWFF